MEKVKGLKTYISAAVLAVLLVVSYFQGWDEKRVQEVIGFGVVAIGVCIRLGIADLLGVSKENQQASKDEAEKAKSRVKSILPIVGAMKSLKRVSTPAKDQVPTIDELLRIASSINVIDIPDEDRGAILKNLSNLLKDHTEKPPEEPELGAWSVSETARFKVDP